MTDALMAAVTDRLAPTLEAVAREMFGQMHAAMQEGLAEVRQLDRSYPVLTTLKERQEDVSKMVGQVVEKLRGMEGVHKQLSNLLQQGVPAGKPSGEGKVHGDLGLLFLS